MNFFFLFFKHKLLLGSWRKLSAYRFLHVSLLWNYVSLFPSPNIISLSLRDKLYTGTISFKVCFWWKNLSFFLSLSVSSLFLVLLSAKMSRGHNNLDVLWLHGAKKKREREREMWLAIISMWNIKLLSSHWSLCLWRCVRPNNACCHYKRHKHYQYLQTHQTHSEAELRFYLNNKIK